MDTIIISFAGLSMLLLMGKLLRTIVKPLQYLYLPAAVIGGLLGLIVIQTGLVIPHVTIPASWIAGWAQIPGIFINIVFAALFLGLTIPPLTEIWRYSASQLAYGQIVAWGQYVFGIGMVLFLLEPMFGISGIFGVIVPVGFEGGHGTAGGLMQNFADMGKPELGDYALAAATAGILLAIISGMVLINWAVYRGHVQHLRPFNAMTKAELSGIYPIEQRPAAGFQTVSADSLDSLALHLSVIGIAILIGFLGKQYLIGLRLIDRERRYSNAPINNKLDIGNALKKNAFKN